MSLSAPTDGSAAPEPSPSPPPGSGTPRRVIVAHSLHERIQIASARAVATHGYEATTIADICSEAQITEQAFHEHFKNKQEAAMSALETSADQVMTDLRATFAAAPSWPEAIWDSIGAVLEWMTHEPAFTRLGVVEMITAGEAALELMQSLMDAFAMFLEPGYELLCDKTASKRLVDEMVANGIFGILYERITREGTDGIAELAPEMVRTILTPFLGSEQAAAFVAQHSAQG